MELQWHGLSPKNLFCRWIVVCFMCAHEISYVYSHVCVKAPCFDDNLVRYLHISAFGTFSRQSSSKVPTRHVTVWFCEPKFCERKRTCLVGALCNVIGILSTTYKVCVMRCWSTVWCSLLILKMSWCPAAAALNSWHSRLWCRNSSLHPLRVPITRSWENQVSVFHKCLYDMDCCTTALYLLVLSWLKTKPKSR